MKPAAISLSFILTLTLLVTVQIAPAAEPLRALLIIGGCCHDYGNQKDVLKEGIEARANVKVDIAYSRDRNTRARFENYEKDDWAKNYDTIIHDECSSDVTDMPYVKRILQAHKNGVGAVNLHCAMHSYRTGTDDWFEYLGLQSTGHGPQKPIAIKHLDTTHPITKGLADWTTINEELYNNQKVFESSHVLATGTQVINGENVSAVVTWVNNYGKARVFSTTIGHNTRTVADDRYLDLVTRGLLWSCRQLDSDGKPKPGYGK